MSTRPFHCSFTRCHAMNAFEFSSVVKIIFGRGKIAQLGGIARGLGTAALMIHNGDDPGNSGPVDRAVASLQSTGIRVCFQRQRGEPTIGDVDAALAVARQNQCDLVIGLGGGSAIDTAKATAGLMTNGGQCLDYMEVIGKGQTISKPAMPWIAVPTTAGTGAEVTKNAVIASPEHKLKVSIRSEHLLAEVALVDPDLGENTPQEVRAASGMDALCQLIESFTSNGSNTMTDALAMRALEMAIGFKTEMDPEKETDHRERMAYAALVSGWTLANAGLGAVHGFAAPIGANFPIPHGVICARLLPFVVEANMKSLLLTRSNEHALKGYLWLNQTVPPIYSRSSEMAVVNYLHDMINDLRVRPLSQYGIQEKDIPGMVALAKKTSSMKYNPVVLADDVLANILRSAL